MPLLSHRDHLISAFRIRILRCCCFTRTIEVSNCIYITAKKECQHVDYGEINFGRFSFVCLFVVCSICQLVESTMDDFVGIHNDRSISISQWHHISHRKCLNLFFIQFFWVRFILSRWHCVVRGNVHIDAIRQSSILYTVNLFRLFWSSCARMFSHESLMIVDRRHESAMLKKWIHRSFLLVQPLNYCFCWLENGLLFPSPNWCGLSHSANLRKRKKE